MLVCSQEAKDKLGALPKILEKVGSDLKDPQVNQRNRPQPNRKSQHYDNLVNIQAHIDNTTSSTELLRDMLKHCGELSGDLPVTESSDSPNGSVENVCDSDSNYATEDSAMSTSVSTSKTTYATSEVSNVSVSAKSTVNKSSVNKSWKNMVSAAEIVNGDYIDLINFMDEEGNDSIDSEHNPTGSQMSISQVSTIASSGYQSFGYSQSSSPIDGGDKAGDSNELRDHRGDPRSKSPNNNSFPHSTPLSFANPMYRINHRGMVSSHKTSSPVLQMSSSSSLSSEEAHTVKNLSPVKSEQLHRRDNKQKKTASAMSNSSSTDSVQERGPIHHSVSNNNVCSLETDMDSFIVPKHSLSNNNVSSLTMEINNKPRHSQSNNSISARKEIFLNGNTHTHSQPSASTRKYSLEIRSSSPVLSHSAKSVSSNATTTYYNTIGSTSSRRVHELSQSADLSASSISSSSSSNRFTKSDSIRRTATDTSISQRSSSSYSDGSPTSSSSSPRGGISPDDSSLFRRLSAQNAVHMGIRSVQRRIHEQEKTKQEVGFSTMTVINFQA